MAENNAVCSICGKEYYTCLSCHDSIKINPWKMFTDTSEHYKVFQVVRGYNTNVYTKEEAKIKLENINLEDVDNFRPHIRQIVKDILKEEKPIINSVEMKIATEENKKSSISRKRNNKINKINKNETNETIEK